MVGNREHYPYILDIVLLLVGYVRHRYVQSIACIFILYVELSSQSQRLSLLFYLVYTAGVSKVNVTWRSDKLIETVKGLFYFLFSFA